MSVESFLVEGWSAPVAGVGVFVLRLFVGRLAVSVLRVDEVESAGVLVLVADSAFNHDPRLSLAVLASAADDDARNLAVHEPIEHVLGSGDVAW